MAVAVDRKAGVLHQPLGKSHKRTDTGLGNLLRKPWCSYSDRRFGMFHRYSFGTSVDIVKYTGLGKSHKRTDTGLGNQLHRL